MPLDELDAKLRAGNQYIQDLKLYPGDAVNRGCREGWELEVFAPDGKGWSFLVDDEPLPMSSGRTWCWAPGFFAGLVNAELRRDAKLVASYRLEVSPNPEKLAMPLYQSMLKELLELDPTLVVGTEPATERLGTLGSQRNAWLEFRRLRLHTPEFLAALRHVVQRPIRTVRASRRIAPLRAARRVDIRTVRTAAAMGAIAPLMANHDATPTVAQTEPNYDLPWFEEHLDAPANRCITAMLLAVRRRAVQLQDSLGRQVRDTQDSETRTGLAKRWAARRDFLEDLRRQLNSLLRDEPFCTVTNPEMSAAGLNAITAHPIYARAYRCGWQAIRPGLQCSNTSEAVWLCPSWELYERWCFGRVIQFLVNISDHTHPFHWDSSGGVWKGRTAQGVRISAYSQRTFTSNQSAEFHSISRERRPDIVVTAELEERQHYMVLDAKYSQARSGILNAMASAHIYHDSLRWNGRRPLQALLLAPAGGGAPWLEGETFIDRENVGVVALSPDDGNETLNRHLQRLMDFSLQRSA